MAKFEVITGPERRRRWSEDQKRAIVAESFAPGAVVAESRFASGTTAIEIVVGGTVVRAGPGVDLAFLGEIIRLLKATA